MIRVEQKFGTGKRISYVSILKSLSQGQKIWNSRAHLYLKIKLSGPAGWVYTLGLLDTKADFSGKEIVRNERWRSSFKVKFWRREDGASERRLQLPMIIRGQRRRECEKGTAELKHPEVLCDFVLEQTIPHSLLGLSWRSARIQWEKYHLLNQLQCFWLCICSLGGLTVDSN